MRIVCLVAICALALLPCALPFEQGQVDALPQTCKGRLDQIYAQYYSIDVLEGTIDCKQIIQSDLANTNGVNCSDVTTLRACFNYARQPWVDFVKGCELFTPPPACSQGGPCKKPVSDNPWWLRVLNALWRPATYDYGTGLVPNQGQDWQTFAGEGEGTRRRYRRLFQEGEGGSVQGSAGCFPDFYDARDFQDWLGGSYQEPDYVNTGPNSVAIIIWIVHGLSILTMSAM